MSSHSAEVWEKFTRVERGGQFGEELLMINWKLTGKRAGTLTCVVAVFAGIFFMCATAAYAINEMPSSGEKHNMRLVGYNDLQGRESLQVTTS